MALQNEQDQLTAAWRALGAESGQGWRAIELVRKLNCTVHAGRRAPGNEESLLIGIEGSPVARDVQLPRGQGFSLTRTETIDAATGRTWFALARNTGGQLGLFSLMAADLVALLAQAGDEEPSRIYSALMARIRAWQEFMKRDRTGVLSAEEEVGLFGELLVLKDILGCGMNASDAVDSWEGPDDGLHDFLIGTGAIEVKSTVSPVGFVAEIANLDQLDDSLRRPLYVGAVRLAQTTSGQTLPELCDELAAAVQEATGVATLLWSKLLSAGYIEAIREQYTRRFVQAHLGYRLIGDDSPRLTRSNVPVAVQRVKYAMDLGVIPEVATRCEEIMESLGVNAAWN
ncbi:MAG TPA: PD-(D/E)XK motif protein [Chiayiivirga sp.]|nr:PD-(D/E)XK motif protein [Chiayiivirga sp.]